jgi:hypothetical protein
MIPMIYQPQETPSICYLDLDGVLVDFVRGAFALHGKEIPYPEVRWDFDKQLGIPPEVFWGKMGKDFWEDLPWTQEGPDLIKALETIFGSDNIVLMTSPVGTPGGVEGKVNWIRRELPGYSRRFFIGPPKHMLAGPGKLLVDDHDENIDKFCAAGGKAIMVPRPWNRRRDETFSDGVFDVWKLAFEVKDTLK